jgi:hypothetical protein
LPISARSPTCQEQQEPGGLAQLNSESMGGKGDEVPICLAGRGASPPEYRGGPTGYRLMLNRQRESEVVRIDHEQILCNNRVKVAAEITPSFELLMRHTINKARDN